MWQQQIFQVHPGHVTVQNWTIFGSQQHFHSVCHEGSERSLKIVTKCYWMSLKTLFVWSCLVTVDMNIVIVVGWSNRLIINDFIRGDFFILSVTRAFYRWLRIVDNLKVKQAFYNKNVSEKKTNGKYIDWRMGFSM